MNRLHRWYCQSGHWRKKLENEILPWCLDGVDLGETVLELGPGPGLTTEWLHRRCRSLTCLEVDVDSATSLARRVWGKDVTVLCGDATAVPYRGEVFSGTVAMTMLHHVASATLQDKLFREVWRVLRPGGVFAGSDSLSSWLMRMFHIRDTLVIIQPETLGARLESVGFVDVRVDTGGDRFRFIARRPGRR
jgi:SAM-dependent methyltransferase